MFGLKNNSEKAYQARCSNRQILSLFSLTIFISTLYLCHFSLGLELFDPVKNYTVVSEKLAIGQTSFPKGSNGYDRILVIMVETLLIGLIIAPLIIVISTATIVIRNLYFILFHYVSEDFVPLNSNHDKSTFEKHGGDRNA